MGHIKEQNIEEELITRLQDLKYTYRQDIRDKASLEANFREKFEDLNRVKLTDEEFARLKEDIITSDVFEASKKLRNVNDFERQDGTPLNYQLVNLDNWCKNTFEVTNQLRLNTEYSYHRYDVVLLINGIPMVQIELKTLQINPRRAMQQIVDYKNDAGSSYSNSLLCFMQLFIVSNSSDTFYFANNRNEHFTFDAEERFLPVYRHAKEDNEKVTDLHKFVDAFLHKCTLAQLLSRYMVLVATEQKVLVMRPYQIYAVKAIVDCIEENRGNGYIWHTTGSGKTLTSFKASTLLKSNPNIDKCLFVVDRKDLDRQTRQEFNRFQEGCVEHNTNTEALVRRLLSEAYADKVIVTTIQKLGLALDENSKRNRAKERKGKETYKDRLEVLRNKRMVFIFDECHRSQFGENHQAIKSFFPNAQLFGFTGTPIFDKNATYITIEGETKTNKTTEDIFQKELHEYTITHAIEDKNVLSFHIDYYGEEVEGDTKDDKEKSEKIKAKQVENPPPEAVIKEILKKHDKATKERQYNAILATASINLAIDYYKQFKAKQAELKQADDDYQALNIACVFSPPVQLLDKEKNANPENTKDIKQLEEDLEQERYDNKRNPEEKKAALEEIIADYNVQYGTNHSILEFDSYYQDVQQRIKDHQYSNQDYPHENKIDITIVVDMLLTGFDSKFLNTLYVDKNLKYHGLIQAFSRTNRVLNDTKPHGNILDFRAQRNAVDTAITLFSGKEGDQAREIWLVDPAPKLIEKLDTAVTDLQDFMQSEQLSYAPEDVPNLKGDLARAEFVNRFKEVQRLTNQLEQYTDLDEGAKQSIEAIIPENTKRAFKAAYNETAYQLKALQDKLGENAPEQVQQLDFEFVLFASALIDYDYIMSLLAKSTQAKGRYKMTREQVIELIKADPKFANDSDDLIAYINNLPIDKALSDKEIKQGFETFKNDKHATELAAIAKKHKLAKTELKKFVDHILYRMVFDGEDLTDLMAPLDLGWKERRVKELELMEELIPLLNKLSNGRNIAGLDVYD